MARQGYVNYSAKAKQKKSLIYFAVSVVVIFGVYVGVRQIWGGGADDSSQLPAATEPVVTVVKPDAPALRQPPATEPTRAVVKPDIAGAPAPAGAPAVDPAAQTPEVPVVIAPPVKTQEDILADMIQQATDLARAGKIVESRDQLYSLMQRYPDSPQRLKIKKLLGDLANQWLFGDKVLAGDTASSYYKVQSGDLLSRIGNRNDVPWEFLLKVNKILRPEQLRAGQTIKVVKGPFNAVISRSNFTMDVYLDDVYVKSYKVGLGSLKHTTPTGVWVVGQDKLISPSWTDPDTRRTYDATDKDYPLGKRWIGLRGIAGEATGRTGFALHGTNEPESIGQRSSRGCIRLADDDILEVYDLMTPGKSQVQVID